jgi:hypothetical protein
MSPRHNGMRKLPGLVKAYGKSSVMKAFTFNNRFKIKVPDRLKSHAGISIAGGDIIFNCGKPFFPKEFRTVFGPAFSQNTFMYFEDENGIRGAVRRVTAVRENDVVLHEQLIKNQQLFIRDSADVRDFFYMMLVMSDTVMPDIYSEEYRKMWVESTHPKRQERRNAFKSIAVFGGQMDYYYTRKVDYKCKRGELLAANKYLRAIGDLTCPGSLKGAYLIDAIKYVFAQEHFYKNGSLEYVKTPDLAKLRVVFKRLWCPERDVTMVYFSDDSCVSIRCLDGTYVSNMDISSADGSNYEPIFKLLFDCMNVRGGYCRDLAGMFAQLELVCKVVNPQDSTMRVTMEPKGKVLYSGSALTTMTNNTSNSVIFCSIIANYKPMLLSECEKFIKDCANKAGFIVKAARCENIEDVQFLKYSPHVNMTGELDAVLNLGVLLRGFGHIDGELPGRGDLYHRARVFLSDVVKSRVHTGNHCIADAFQKFVITEEGKYSDYEKLKYFGYLNELRSGEQLGYVGGDSICRRYRICSSELAELCTYIRSAEIGDVIDLPVVSKILDKDYGYGYPDSVIGLDVGI